MKKTLKIIGIIVVLLVAAAVVLPYIFKDKIKNIATTELNKQLNAEVSFKDIDLSLFRHFPDFSLQIEDLCVKGKGHFAKDSLVFIENLDFGLSFCSVFSNPLEVKSIFINNAKVNALVAANGQVNWDITLPSEDKTTTTETKEEEPYQIALKQLNIKNAQIIYADSSMQLVSQLQHTDVNLSGDFSSASAVLELMVETPSVSVVMEHIPYLYQRHVIYKGKIDADMEKMRFTLQNNKMWLQKLLLEWQGFVQMNEDDSYDLDLKFHAPNNNIAELLTLIPSDYQDNIKDIKTSGNFKFSGFAKGKYTDNSYPQFEIDLGIDKGKIQYPGVDLPIEDIKLDVNIKNPSYDLDHTVVSAPAIQWKIANNPFFASLLSKTPISNPYIEFAAKGIIDFADMQKVYPMENMELAGKIQIKDLSTKLHMSDIDAQAYDRIVANGHIAFDNVIYQNKEDNQEVRVPSGNIYINPQELRIEQLKTLIGSSDIMLEGQLTNFLNYYFKDDMLEGEFKLTSKLIDANALMSESTSETNTKTVDTTSISTTFSIPENLNIQLSTNVDKLLYNQLSIENIEGKLKLYKGKAKLNPLRMKLLGSQIACQGTYQALDSTQADTKMRLNIQQLDISKAAITFLTIKKLFPIAKNMQGLVDIDLHFAGKLDGTMAPIMPSINGKGSLISKSIGVKDSKLSQSLGKVLTPKSNGLGFKDINLSFDIKDGKIEVKSQPFKLDKYPARFGGYQGLDKSIDYALSIDLPKKLLGADLLGGLSDQIKIADIITTQLKVQGTLSQPKFGLGFGANGASLKEKAQEVLDQAKQKAIAEAQKQADKLLKEAELKGQALVEVAQKQAKQIKAEAQAQADKLRADSDKEVDDLVKQAGNNPLAKKAAQAAGKKAKAKANEKIQNTLNKANTKADKLVEEAENKKQQLINNAQKEGDKLVDKAKGV